MKTLKQIRELYQPETKDGKNFVAKHTVKKTPDANKNKDEIFNGSNVKSAERQPKHGYNPGQDEKVYEEVQEGLLGAVLPGLVGGAAAGVGGYLAKKILPKEKKEVEKEVKETTAWKKQGMDSDKLPSGVDPLYARETLQKSAKTISKTDPKISDKFTSKKLMKMFPLKKEEVEIDEVLKPSMGADAYIKDFVKSKDPRFKDASKKDRIKRALAAYYSAKRGD